MNVLTQSVGWMRRAYARCRPTILSFIAVFLINILFFGNIFDLHTYKVEFIYGFSEKSEYLTKNVVELINQEGETSNNIVNTYMNINHVVGGYFRCTWWQIFCAMFEDGRNKRGFIRSHILKSVVHPIWNCLHERDGDTSTFVEFGVEPPQCYGTFLPYLARVSTEDHTSVEKANDALGDFREKLRKAKDELEWEPAERAARSMLHAQNRLIRFVRKMRILCQENATGVDYCSDVDISGDDIEVMATDLQTFAWFAEMSGEDQRMTPWDFLIKNAVGSLIGVLVVNLLSMAVSLNRHSGVQVTPQNPDPSSGGPSA